MAPLPHAALLLVALAIDVTCLLVLLGFMTQTEAKGTDEARTNGLVAAVRGAFAMGLAFAMLVGVAFFLGLADTWVVVFASLFVIARMVHLMLALRNGDGPAARLARNAMFVALAALGALLALDLSGGGVAGVGAG